MYIKGKTGQKSFCELEASRLLLVGLVNEPVELIESAVSLVMEIYIYIIYDKEESTKKRYGVFDSERKE